jgi:hypothetical protein
VTSPSKHNLGTRGPSSAEAVGSTVIGASVGFGFHDSRYDQNAIHARCEKFADAFARNGQHRALEKLSRQQRRSRWDAVADSVHLLSTEHPNLPDLHRETLARDLERVRKSPSHN